MSINCRGCDNPLPMRGWCLHCGTGGGGSSAFMQATEGLSRADRIKATLLLNGIPAAPGSKEGQS